MRLRRARTSDPRLVPFGPSVQRRLGANPPETERRGLFFGLVGEVAVWRDGELLDLGTPQQRRLLALLVLHRNEVVSTDRMIDALWRGAVPRNALQTVRTYVSRLRTCFGSESSSLQTTAGGYRLVIPTGQTDVDVLEALALAGRTALEAGDAAAASAQLEKAVATARGRPLAGLEFDDFARYEIERLEELRLAIVEDLVEARLLEGRHHELVPELRAMVETNPVRERLWSQLMLALYRSGRQAEALQAYRQARDVLAEQLGLEPGPELRELERMILLQEGTLEHGAVGRLHLVPRYVTSFIGREDQIDIARGLVDRERMVTIVGAAGSGKTRLAAEVASRLRAAFAEGVWWVDLASVRPADVTKAFADSLGVRRHPGRSTPDLVVSRLRAARVLLVVDNCEHVAGALAPLLARILTETAPTRILATSREPVRVAGERVQRLPPLSVPPDTAIGPDRVMEYEAARLLVARASAGDGSVTLDPSAAGAIATIVSRLDGLPLAIELAAGQLRSMSLRELAVALDSRLDLLAGGDRGAPARQQTLEGAISWSFELLSSDERKLLERLTVFPASFDAHAAEAVAADTELERARVLSWLAQMVDKSLISAEPGEPTRYRLLTTVRTFATARATDTGQLGPAVDRHADYFADLADELFWDLVGPQLGTWLVRAKLDQPNFHAALHRSLERGDGELALRLASALFMFWFRTGQLREWRELGGQALALAGSSSKWRARGLVGMAWLCLVAGDEEALQPARDAVTACEDGEPALLGLALAALAQCHMAMGELDEAEATIRRSQEVFVETAFAEGIQFSEQLLGEARYRRGKVEDALDHLRRSRDLYRELRGDLDAGWTLVLLAKVALDAGHVEEAAAAARDAIADFRLRGDPRGVASACVVRGRTYLELGDRERGQELLLEARGLAREWGYPKELADAESVLAGLMPTPV